MCCKQSHVLKFDAALNVFQHARVRRLGEHVGHVHRLEDAVGAGGGRGRAIDEKAEPLHGAVEHLHVEEHGRKRAHAQLAVDDARPAEPEQQKIEASRVKVKKGQLLAQV